MNNEQLTKQDHLQVETALEAVPDVLKWCEQFISPLLPPKFCWECKTALIEGFTNAVRHAHEHLPQNTTIELELKLCSNYLEIKIWDQGEPFDLRAKLQEILEEIRQKKIDPLDMENHRGLLWMDQLMDELAYERLPDQRNCLVMRKQR
ncbi:MAG: ATP-binding protein [Symploca sp. SIO1B1]|nr:ATP-binding protein [Symploca sp. SIO1C2]NER46449.1 ATP-binding protein [Symploca sp. SIO1A3]NER94496.1 ATP-binding protein [Symploca sp. SIO1B1]